MEYNCNICNKSYSSYQSIWIHNKKFHSNTNTSNDDTNNKKYKCRGCNKFFSKIQNRWRHEKDCNELNIKNKDHKKFEDEINNMKKEIENLKNKPNTIINNNINNGAVYNFLNKVGQEDISVLNEKEIEYIMDQELNCIISLINLLNFNQEIPENHTFCTTALNNKYISTINPETLEIEKKRKKDFYDTLLWNGINKMKLLYEKIKNKKSSKIIQYKENIDKLVDYIIVNDKGKKTFVELINALTFNNRHTVQTTWNQLKNNQVPDFSRKNNDIMLLSNDENNNEIIKEESYESSSNDSNSDEESDEIIKISYKNNNYIFKNNKLYHINDNQTQGKLFGLFINGRIRKLDI